MAKLLFTLSALDAGVHSEKYNIAAADWASIGAAVIDGVLGWSVINNTDSVTVYSSATRVDL